LENLNNAEPTAPVVVTHGDEKGLSFRGLFEVFYQPGKFFNKLKDNPKILVPYLAVIILSLIALILLSDVLLDMTMESEAMQERLQGQQLPPEAIKIQKIAQVVIGTLFSALIPLFIAALAWFWGNFVFAGKAQFKQVFSVVLYGQFLFSVGGLLATFIILAKGSMMAPFSLGVLVADQGFSSVIYTALSKIDLFNIWEIIVTGIGLASIYNIERNKGYMISVLSVGLISVMHIVLAMIGKLFM